MYIQKLLTQSGIVVKVFSKKRAVEHYLIWCLAVKIINKSTGGGTVEREREYIF